MKSYTDLEQSKTLAEVLPIESADQTWVRIAIAGVNLDVPEELQYRHNGDIPFQFYSGIGLPCWSLAALLNVFSNSEQKCVDICHGGWKGEEYVSDWFCSYDDYEKNYFETTNSDNPVDACVEMIIKLKENKML